MKRQRVRMGALKTSVLMLMLGAALRVHALDAKAAYPSMAPLDQYLIPNRDDEIALARSAAPESISRNAEVLILGRRGYETAVQGTNSFACIVQRSWTAGADDPDFWNPKLRAPICFNAAAAWSYLPYTIKKTELIVAGRSKSQTFDAIQAAIEKKELPPMESGAMCYMMSKQGYLSDRAGPGRPHLMFFAPLTEPTAWGAGLPGSPIIASKVTTERLTVFLIPVGQWSDGTPAPAESTVTLNSSASN